jgi:hypothetical protein
LSADDTAALLHFDETDVGVQPADAVQGLDDLVVPTGLTAPAIVEGWFGSARRFAAGTGLEGAELDAGNLLLRRSMAIEAWVNLAPACGSNGSRTIVARGRRGSSAERRLFGLRVDVAGAPSAPIFTLRLGWDQGATPAAVAGADFVMRTPGWVYLAAVRRWFSAGEVEVDYYANGEPIGTISTAAGAIVDGEGGHTAFGCEGDGAGGYVNEFLGDLDEVRISRVERTAEEIRQTFRRIMVYQAYGYEALKALLPPGKTYSQNPASAIQRELMVEGAGLGFAWSKLAELEDDFLPDRATGHLPRWEEALRLEPGPADLIAARRARCVSFLRKVHGFGVEQIKEALAPVLDCQPSDLEIIENDNTGPDPDQVFQWFVYRPSSVPGRPDFITAQRMLDEMKPAHTRGIIGQRTSLRFDDPESLFDRDLFGV